MSDNKRINIYLPVADIEKLRFIAYKKHTSISAIIREVVKKVLSRKDAR